MFDNDEAMNFSDVIATTGGQLGYEESADVNIPVKDLNHNNIKEMYKIAEKYSFKKK